MKCDCEIALPNNTSVSSVCLRDLSVFDSVSDDDFERFKAIGLRKTFRKGQALFVQGSPINEVFVIKAGRIRLSKVLDDGTEITLDFRKPGDFIGEEAFSREVEYPLTAYAIEEALTCGFRVRDFKQLILDNPDVGLSLIANMAETILTLSSRLENMTAGALEYRILQVLSGIATEHGRRTPRGHIIDFPLTHEDLGYLVGAHRVSITKALKKLTDMGKITREGKQLVLPMNTMGG